MCGGGMTCEAMGQRRPTVAHFVDSSAAPPKIRMIDSYEAAWDDWQQNPVGDPPERIVLVDAVLDRMKELRVGFCDAEQVER